MKRYIIIPFCSDLNRGDQALVWETKKIAEESGFKGKYFLIAEKNEPVEQSKKAGLGIAYPVLEHPSRFDKKDNNLNYNLVLKFRWGVIAIFDLVFSALLLNSLTRKLAYKLLSKEKKYTFDLFASSDAIFMKGGGIIHSYGGITSFYHMYYALYNMLLAHSLKKDVYILPNSFGPFKGIGVNRLVKTALLKCRLVTSRETVSTEMLKDDLNLEVGTYPDLGFFLDKTDIEKESFNKRYKIPNNRKVVAFTMRPYRFPDCENPKKSYKNYKQAMRKFIIWLYEQGYMPLIVEHTLAVHEHEDDGKCIVEVTKKLNPNHYRLVADRTLNCSDLKGIYSHCDYIIGTRFHSVIFSMAESIPGIAITYGGNKGEGIMKDVGLQECSLSINAITYESLKKSFLYLVENERSIKEKIRLYLETAKNKRRELIYELQK